MRTSSHARSVALLLAAAGTLAGCQGQTDSTANTVAPVLEPVATTREVMLGITIPASDAIFQVAAEMPATDADWESVRVQALALAESGNLLMIGSRVVDQGDWLEFSKQLIETAKAAAQAAAEKDAEKVSAAGDSIYEVCDSCHRKYMPARAGEESDASATAP